MRIEDDVIVEDVEMFKLRFELNEELMDCRVELAEPSVVDITIEDDDRELRGLSGWMYVYVRVYVAEKVANSRSNPCVIFHQCAIRPFWGIPPFISSTG